MKPGDVVILRSGGPKMTVESIDPQGRVHCTWFNEVGNYAVQMGGGMLFQGLPMIASFLPDSLKNV